MPSALYILSRFAQVGCLIKLPSVSMTLCISSILFEMVCRATCQAFAEISLQVRVTNLFPV